MSKIILTLLAVCSIPLMSKSRLESCQDLQEKIWFIKDQIELTEKDIRETSFWKRGRKSELTSKKTELEKQLGSLWDDYRNSECTALMK